MTVLTAAYVVVMALVFSTGSTNSTVEGVLFGEILFAGPMVIAYALSIWMRRVEAHRVLLAFQVGFSILTAIIYNWTFAGEHDAQYQLTLLFIPLIGFPAVAIAGLAAAFAR
jgi:hypothetical protein